MDGQGSDLIWGDRLNAGWKFRPKLDLFGLPGTERSQCPGRIIWGEIGIRKLDGMEVSFS